MIRNKRTIQVKRGRHDTFNYLCKPEYLVKWIGGLQTSAITSKGKPRVGTTFRQQMEFAGYKEVFDGKVIEFEEGQRLAFKVRTPFCDVFGRFTLESTRRGLTRINYVEELQLKGVFKVMMPLLKILVLRKQSDDFSKLKSLLDH